MSIANKYSVLRGFAVAFGHKMLRGGRLSKRGGQVVSFSPHVAELLGSVSRAAMGGALILGSAIAAPAALADECEEGIPCNGSNIGESEEISHEFEGDADLSFGNSLNTVTDASVAVFVSAGGNAQIAIGEGSSVLATHGNGLVVNANEQIHIELAGEIGALQSAVVAQNFGSENQHINLTLFEGGSVDAGLVGLSATSLGAGNVDITNGGIITAGTGIQAVSSNFGDVIIQNDGEISMIGDGAVGVSVAHSGAGNVTVTNTYGIYGNVGNFRYDTEEYTTGILVHHSGQGDVDVVNSRGLQATGRAIDIVHESEGNVTVDLAAGSQIYSFGFLDQGEDEYGTLFGGVGVNVERTSSSVGDVTVNSNGSVFGFDHAIAVNHVGTGDANINVGNSGSVNLFDAGAIQTAILAGHSGAGDLNVTLGTGARVVSGVVEGFFSESDQEFLGEGDANGIELYRGPDAVGATTVVLEDGSGLWATDNGIRLFNQGEVDTSVTLKSGSTVLAAKDGIGWSNSGAGSLNIDVAGTITTGVEADPYELEEGEEPSVRPLFRQNGGDAIVALGGGKGDQVVNLTGTLDAAGSGIVLVHAAMNGGRPSQGDILVNIDGGSILAGHTGVEVAHYGMGNVDIDNTGSIAAATTGINAAHSGVGKLTVDNATGGVIASDLDGINAYHGGVGDMAVTNHGTIEVLPEGGTVFHPVAMWDTAGIRAVRASNGNVNVINAAGGVISGYNRGIDAVHGSGHEGYFGNINVANAGSISASRVGIMAAHFGSNDVNIANTGSLEAAIGIGAVHHGAGDMVISNGAAAHAGAVINADLGILASHEGYGDITVVNAGNVTAEYEGIVATHGLAGVNDWSRGDFEYWSVEDYEADGMPTSGEITITNSGNIQSNSTAVTVLHVGRGDVEVSNLGGALINTALHENGNGDGIRIDRFYEDASTITNAGAIHSNEHGIVVTHANGGDVTITNAATGEIRSEENDAIEVNILSGNGNVVVRNAGRLVSDNEGIEIYHSGNGDITVENAGVIAAEGHGIQARLHQGNGDVTIASSGDIYAEWGSGIYVGTRGNGQITVSANNVAVGDDGDSAIEIEKYGSGDVDITTTGIVSGDRAAISAWAFDGDITITNGANGLIKNRSGKSVDLAVTTGASYDWDDSDFMGSANTLLVNNGTIIGTVDFSYTGAGNTVTFTNNGLWYNTDGVNYMGQGVNTLTIGNGGVWHAAGSTTYFGSQPNGLLDFSPFSATSGNVLTIEEGGRVQANNASFVGLDSLVVNGMLNAANGVAGEAINTDGEVVFGENSIFNVDTRAGGISDTLYAIGNVTVNGGTLNVIHTGASPAAIGDVFTVIESLDGEVTGWFDNTEVEHTAFLGWEIDYTDDAVNLTYAQLHDLDDAAATANQGEVADGLDSLAGTSSLLRAALDLGSFEEARKAFDSLSGEIHPGARTAIMQDSRLARNAVLERLQTPQGGAIWGQGFWNTGKTDGAKSGSTAKIDRETWGVLAGADIPLGENAVLGVAGSYLSSDLTQSERNASGKAETIHALGYIGAKAGAANFKAGVGYAWGDVETTRSAKVGTISNTLTADYDATLLQAFAEAGFRIALGSGYVEPMASVTYLKAKSDAFVESGGAAALTAEAASQDNTLLTVGSRFSTAKTGALSVRGMAGWQHVFGGLVPTNSFKFSGGENFTVAGVAQSRDAAVVNIEAVFDLSAGAALGIGYDAVVGRDSQDHAAKVSLRIKF